MKNTLLFFLVVFLISACHKKQSDKLYSLTDDIGIEEEIIPISRQQEISQSDPGNSATNEIPLSESKEVIKKKIIKDGRIGIEVKDLEKAKVKIDSLVNKLGGYYANEKLETWSSEIKYNLKIRIPNDKFEKLIDNIDNGYGKILYKEIDARDVTDQFIDLETRLANKRNYLKRYNELLLKAKTVKDILEIEEKIRGIEEEVESTTGRLKYLNDIVDYSTLNLMISEPKDLKYQSLKRDSFTERLKHSIQKGWYGFIDFVIFIIKIWPFWIIVILTIYGWKKYRKRKNKE